MGEAREFEEETVSAHLEVVGFGDDPHCKCRSCRGRWSKATPEERAAVVEKFEKFMTRACGTDTIGGVNRQSSYAQMEREWQAKIAAGKRP